MRRIELTAEHLAAATRRRRIVVNLDTGWGLPGVEDLDPVEFVDAHIDYLTGMSASQVDSIWWCWGDMNCAPYASKILPVNQEYQRWLQQGLDPLPICIDRTLYKNTGAFAQLPNAISVAPACGDKHTGETYLAVMVGDDVDRHADVVERVQMRVLLSDSAAEGTPWEDRIHTEPVAICTLSSRDHAQPPAKSILPGLRARINGVLLEKPGTQEGWYTI